MTASLCLLTFWLTFWATHSTAEVPKASHAIAEIHMLFADPKTGRKKPMPARKADLLAQSTPIKNLYFAADVRFPVPFGHFGPEVYLDAEVSISLKFETDEQAQRFFSSVVNNEDPLLFAYDWLSPDVEPTGPGRRSVRARALFYWDEGRHGLVPLYEFGRAK